MSLTTKPDEVGHAQAAVDEGKIKSKTDTPQAIQSAINVFAYAAGSRKTTATPTQMEELLSKQDPSSWVIMQKLLTTKESWEAVMTGIQKVNPDILKDAYGFVEFLKKLTDKSTKQPAIRYVEEILSRR